MRIFISVLLFCAFSRLSAQQTVFEKSKGTQTPTYSEIISWWQELDHLSAKVKVLTMGMTDAGYPLHLILISNDGDYNITNIHKKNKTVIFFNNGIHPGEPDGIDASMLLARDIVQNKYKIADNIVVAIIPVYNIGGCLNRSPDYRVDQNGPEEFGFRGNAQNLDLNRDFTKCDSKNARSFTEIFHLLDPDVFVDNHVSDGADYQHVMTLICSQHDKLGGVMGEFMNKKFEPGLYSIMKEKGYDLVPYVNDFDETPEEGWAEFFDSPRYGSGYAALWNTFSFIPETHMLKPYDQRVKATYSLMQSFIEFTTSNAKEIKQIRQRSKDMVKTQADFPISWELDKAHHSPILFKGYASGHKPSQVSGLPRLFYDRNKPFNKEVPFYNFYTAKNFIHKPSAYVIPQGWWKIIDLLKLNKVNMVPFKKDTMIEVEVYKIEKYQSYPRQYESHHLNYNVQATKSVQKIKFRKGDYYIPMDQEANRFIIEMLEPSAEDSYFAWNFFDAILGQKEGFSSYSFEDIAADYLDKNPSLKEKLTQQVASDTSFAKNAQAQLNFVFKNSPYYEPDHLRYPVYRVN